MTMKLESIATRNKLAFTIVLGTGVGRKGDSLSLRGPRGNEARPLSLGGCRRGGKSLIISLSVGLLVGKGRRSLSGWINWNRKVRFFLAVDLVDGYIWLSVGGSPPRRWSSLSMPLRDSYSESILIMFLSFDSVGFSYEGINVRRRNQLAFDMFCGKRGQEGSSIQVNRLVVESRSEMRRVKEEAAYCGVFLYTAIASFSFRGTVALTAPISPAFVSGKAVALIAPFFRRLLLRFDPKSSSRSTLLLFLCSIDSRSENLFSSVLGSKVELGRAFALTPAEAVVLFRWRRGGLVTPVSRNEDYDTCHVHASRGKEETPFWVRTMGLGPNRFMSL
ncbi:hypothetical protein YC2023_102429 [Brassica napus]